MNIDVLPYMPHIEVQDKTFNLLEIHFCIDFGGRQVDCIFQDTETGHQVENTYFYLSNEWKYDWPVDNKLTDSIRNIFDTFHYNICLTSASSNSS